MKDYGFEKRKDFDEPSKKSPAKKTSVPSSITLSDLQKLAGDNKINIQKEGKTKSVKNKTKMNSIKS